MKRLALWHAIEKLAHGHGLTCSGLAKLSSLDATTFNKSKQFSPDGTPHWPSCNTIAKIIQATDITMLEFAQLCMEYDLPPRKIFDRVRKQMP